jgi:hypothetical protein
MGVGGATPADGFVGLDVAVGVAMALEAAGAGVAVVDVVAVELVVFDRLEEPFDDAVGGGGSRG